MIKRPINERFNAAILEGRKVTTIREKAWPVGVPIMLYNWSGKPYRSPQRDLAPVLVAGFWPIRITHCPRGTMLYEVGMRAFSLYRTEGFESREAMDEWFRAIIKPGQSVAKVLMRFKLQTSAPSEPLLWFARATGKTQFSIAHATLLATEAVQ